MRNYLSFSFVLFIAGCASTSPTPMGQNHYTISKTSPACGFRDAGGVKSEIFQEINNFCSAKNLFSEVITIETLDGVIGKRCASATVEFRCVSSASSDPFKPTGKAPERDMNRNPSVASDRGQFGAKPNEPTQIKQEVTIQNSDDVYTELKKLKELLDSKIITQEEFDTRKSKILAK
jgi:Short C-terminal domain